jgi:hypothetical protein
MADEFWTRDQLRYYAPDNTQRLITPQWYRNFILSAFGYQGTDAPGPDDDQVGTAGHGRFDVGSAWLSTIAAAPRAWLCFDGTAGAAVWHQVYPQSSAGGNTAGLVVDTGPGLTVNGASSATFDLTNAAPVMTLAVTFPPSSTAGLHITTAGGLTVNGSTAVTLDLTNATPTAAFSVTIPPSSTAGLQIVTHQGLLINGGTSATLDLTNSTPIANFTVGTQPWSTLTAGPSPPIPLNTIYLDASGLPWVKDASSTPRQIYTTANPPTVVQVLPRGWIDGAMLQYVGATMIGFTAGQATESTNAVFLTVQSGFAKSSAPWAAGGNNGGLDQGAMAAGPQTYHWYLIGKTDGTMDAIFTVNSPANLPPYMPVGWTYYRLVMSLLWSGSAWVPFTQDQDTVLFTNVQTGDNKTLAANVSQLLLPGVPVGLKLVAIVNLGEAASPGGSIYLSSPDQADEVVSGGNPVRDTIFALTGSFGGWGTGQLIRTNTSGQIRAISTTASSVVRVSAAGYIHPRGRNL